MRCGIFDRTDRFVRLFEGDVGRTRRCAVYEFCRSSRTIIISRSGERVFASPLVVQTIRGKYQVGIVGCTVAVGKCTEIFIHEGFAVGIGAGVGYRILALANHPNMPTPNNILVRVECGNYRIALRYDLLAVLNDIFAVAVFGSVDEERDRSVVVDGKVLNHQTCRLP